MTILIRTMALVKGKLTMKATTDGGAAAPMALMRSNLRFWFPEIQLDFFQRSTYKDQHGIVDTYVPLLTTEKISVVARKHFKRQCGTDGAHSSISAAQSALLEGGAYQWRLAHHCWP